MIIKPPSEADIISTRGAVKLANEQRLIASWLPPASESAPVGEEDEDEDDLEGGVDSEL